MKEYSDLYQYSLLKSLYDYERNYIDNFIPLILPFLSEEDFKNYIEVQTDYMENKNQELPLHVLESILDRASKLKYCEKIGKKYKLNEKGNIYLNEIPKEEDIIKRIDMLIYDIESYAKNKNLDYTFIELRDSIELLLRDNLIDVIECLNPYSKPDDIDISIFIETKHLIMEYILYAKYKKQDNYKLFKDIVQGSILTVIFHTRDKSQLKYIEKKGIGNIDIYLDTNFIFSIFGMHRDDINKSVTELYTILRNKNIKLYAFNFTVNEISRVINNYTNYVNRYSKHFKVSSIYSNLKQLGWTRSDAEKFIMNIEEILKNYNINIVYIDEINIDSYIPDNIELSKTIQKYKPLQSNFSRNHDIAAIEHIKKIRKKTIRNFKKSKAIFLTSDKALVRFNYLELNHKADSTICEVILDKTLTNLIWLKNPSINPSLSSIIAISGEKFINRAVWDKFYDILMKLKYENIVDDNTISILLYKTQIVEDLSYYEEEEVEKITPNIVMSELQTINKIKKDIREEILKDIKSQQKIERDKIILERIGEVQIKQNRMWINKINDKKTEIYKNSLKISQNYAYLLSLIITIILCSIPIIILQLKNIIEMKNLLFYVFYLLFIIFISLKYLNVKIKNYIYKKSYYEKIKNLEEILE